MGTVDTYEDGAGYVVVVDFSPDDPFDGVINLEDSAAKAGLDVSEVENV
jgi:hypothetical protein